MTRETGDGRTLRLLFIMYKPVSWLSFKRHESVDVSFVKHTVAAQAVGIRLLRLVMSGVHKHFSVRKGMAAFLPSGMFRPVAYGAAEDYV
jgi:hypothetical protein